MTVNKNVIASSGHKLDDWFSCSLLTSLRDNFPLKCFTRTHIFFLIEKCFKTVCMYFLPGKKEAMWSEQETHLAEQVLNRIQLAMKK